MNPLKCKSFRPLPQAAVRPLRPQAIAPKGDSKAALPEVITHVEVKKDSVMATLKGGLQLEVKNRPHARLGEVLFHQVSFARMQKTPNVHGEESRKVWVSVDQELITFTKDSRKGIVTIEHPASGQRVDVSLEGVSAHHIRV